MKNTFRLALLGGVALLAAAQAQAATLVGLTADNQIIRVDSETRRPHHRRRWPRHRH